MKILHVSNQFLPCIGGIEKIIKSLCDFSKNKNSVICLNKCKGSKKKLKKKEKIGKTEVNRLSFFDLNYYKIAPQILWKINNFDLICIHGLGFFSDYLIATKIIHNKPVLLVTHGGIFHTKKNNLLKQIYFGL